jgi:hypothetical protein
VGVKYCFRYNQRNRAQRAHADGDPIDLTAMPPRLHRRRREKKLMTMDEVNSKFPLLKYKAWRSSREQEGLPTAGGISVPPSRAASIKDGVTDRKSQEATRPLSALSTALAAIHQRPISTAEEITETPRVNETGEEPVISEKVVTTKRDSTKSVQKPNVTNSPVISEDDDDDADIDPIEHAHSSEALCAQPGDTCAICLDVLDDDDDVRGLTCGHAFHAACVDPWLSTRRACCPLCKADYYTPKPRTEGEEAAALAAARAVGAASVLGPHNHRMPMPHHPHATWLGGRSRFFMLAVGPRDEQPIPRRSTQTARSDLSRQTTRTQQSAQSVQVPVARRVVPNPFSWLRGSRQAGARTQNNGPTPGQLEAGNR